MSTIPASEIVQVVPSVLGAGGDALDIVGLMITETARTPIGSVVSFPDAASVATYFGSGTTEAAAAATYFAGFVGSDALPASLLFAQYPGAAVAAFLRGGLFALTVAQMQALSGSLTAVVDGYSHVISSIDLSSYNSYSAAAAGIQAAFTDPTEASFTAAIGGSGTTCTTAGTVLTMGALASGYFSVGDVVSGTDSTNSLPAGTTIVSQLTGTPGGSAGATFTISHAATPGDMGSATVTASSTILDVTVDTDHTIAAGQTVTGSGVAAGTLITSQISGTVGGVGFYRLSGSAQHVASEAMTGVATAPLVTFDSVSGAFVITSGITGSPSTVAFATGSIAASLNLTSATGAVLSQGAAATTPAAFMNGVIAQTTDWATFMTTFDPDGGSGNTVKLAFAAWNTGQNNRYGYVCWDTDASPIASVPATGSLGYLLAQNGNSGTMLLDGDPAIGWNDAAGVTLAAFVCGAAASINFEETNGRTTFASLQQAGLAGTVASATVAVNLGGSPQSLSDRGNGYSFYGAYGAANAAFIWLQRGFVTGTFKWFDSYINEIWLNASMQVALLNLIGASKSIPFNSAGDSLIESALAAPINAGLNFGAIAAGTISAAQIAAVNAAAGRDIATTLQTQGWYLLVAPASSATRAARGPRQVIFYYLDRGSVQSINLSSVAVQ